MAINLQKGERVKISVQHFGVGLGWDPNPASGSDFDLDASAFLVGESGKIPGDKYFVFYNNNSDPEGAVVYSGDDRTGGNSDDGDDETIMIDLSKISPKVTEIVFTASIYDAAARKQNFGQVHNSYIRIFNSDTNEEIARYDLDEDFSVEQSVEFGRLYLRNGEWKFEALGSGFKEDLSYFLSKYN